MSTSSPATSVDVRVENATALITVRRQITDMSRALGFGLVEQTKLITAASELSRNILDHAGKGTVRIEKLLEDRRSGIRLTFIDTGPGIPDIERAMQDGYTSGKGMGMGLPGTKRLVHEFSIESEIGVGARIVVVIWKR